MSRPSKKAALLEQDAARLQAQGHYFDAAAAYMLSARVHQKQLQADDASRCGRAAAAALDRWCDQLIQDQERRRRERRAH